jgi:glycosyltransferase involved in cell wall biosynthesis
MRLAINTRFLLPGQLEGFGWYTHEIARRLVERHPEDRILFLFDRAFDPVFVYGANVTPRVLRPPARHPLLWYAWFEWSVPRALRSFGADVFFSPDSFCSLRSRVPTVMTAHDLVPLHHPEQITWPTRPYLQHFLPRYLRRAERVVTVSNFVRDDLHATAGLDPAKTAVVYNGCRSTFTPLPEVERAAVRAAFAGGQEYFFYSGAIHPRKNLPRLIRAFDRFKTATGAPVRLLLAGRFAWRTGEVTEAWEQARHRDAIRFLGYVEEKDLGRLLASALALTYLSVSEGFGLPVLEAMHAETPVLAARATALPEVAGDAALLVDPFSETDIAAGLERLYTDRDLGRQLVANGRRQRSTFSWDRAADQIYSILQEVARNR